jgi:hypothetical protein
MSAHTVDLAPHRADRITMRVIGGLVVAMAVALAAGQLVVAAHYLWSESVDLSLLADSPLDVAPGEGVQSASVDSVVLRTDALSGSVRALFAGSAVLLGITALIVGFALAWLVFAAASGRPFRTTLSRFSLAAGFGLVLGPLLATALSGFASMQSAVALNDAVGGILLVGFGVTSWGFTIPIIGLGVIALGYLLQRMSRLQRETEGLV